MMLKQEGEKDFFSYWKGLFVAIDPQVSKLDAYPPPWAKGQPKGNCLNESIGSKVCSR